MAKLTVTTSSIPTIFSKFYYNFNTIQAAIDYASEGDIIEVEPNVYSERLVINKSVSIKGLGDFGGVKITNGIDIQTNNEVFIENIIIDRAEYGLQIKQGDVQIKNCAILNMKDWGVLVSVHSRLHIVNTIIQNNKVGVHNFGEVTLEGCQVRNNQGKYQLLVNKNAKLTIIKSNIHEGVDRGIQFLSGSTGVIRYCNFQNNNSYSLFVNNAKVLIDNCDFEGNYNQGKLGSQIIGHNKANIQLKNSRIKNGFKSGFIASESTKGTIYNCTFSGNKGAQLIFQNSCQFVVSDLEIFDGANNGIYLNKSNLKVNNTQLSKQAKTQIYVTNEADLEVSRTDIFSGQGNGINIRGNSRVTIDNCYIKDHSNYPQVSLESSELKMRESKINKSHTIGIYFNKKSKGYLFDCQIYDNNRGLSINDSFAKIVNCQIERNGSANEKGWTSQVFGSNESRFELVNSTIADGPGIGLRLIEKSSGTMKKCIVSGNKKRQLIFRNNSNFNISDSTISEGAMSGIYMDESSLEVSDSEISKHKKAQFYVMNESKLQLNGTKVFEGEANAVVAKKSSNINMIDCHVHNHQKYPQVWIESSELEAENSKISNSNATGIVLKSEAKANLSFSEVYENNLGLQSKDSSLQMNNSEFYKQKDAQIVFNGTSEATLNKINIYQGQTNAIVVRNKAKVHLNTGDIYEHSNLESPTIAIRHEGKLQINSTKIHDNKSTGVSINTKNEVLVEDCYIFNNDAKNQISITDSNEAIIRNTRIINGRDYGISIFNSNPIIEKCFIDNHSLEAIHTDKNSKPIKIDNNLKQKQESNSPDEEVAATTQVESEKGKSLEDLLAELDSYIGLNSVKQKIREFMNVVEMNRFREERGLIANIPAAPHMVFSGNPGTGKTTVGRLVGAIFRKIGLLTKGHLIEVKREDLVGRYIGESEEITKKQIEEALGGVLFIDEAYALSSGDGSNSNDFGTKVIDTLVPALENHRGELMVVVAGYTEEMEQFLSSNPGLKDRFTERIPFEDYTPKELIKIFHKMSAEEGYELTEQAEKLLYDEFIYLYRKRDRTFGNARMARNFLTTIISAQSTRITKIPREEWDEELMVTLSEVDVSKVLSASNKKTFNIPINEELLAERMAQLHNLIGLENVKAELDKRVNLIRYYKQEGRDESELVNHILLYGNPGTGKTEVGRIIAGIYEALGLLKRGDLIEVDRSDLVSQYRGGTEKQTAKQIERSLGSTLFIDEAYTLTNKDSYDSGHTAVEVLLKQMSDLKGEFMVIAAGYKQHMQQFLASNPGLPRRFGLTLEFEDYTPKELKEITKLYLENYHLTEAARAKLNEHYEYLYANRDASFGNAGLARKIAVDTVKNLDYRMSQLSADEINDEMKVRIEVEDLALLER